MPAGTPGFVLWDGIRCKARVKHPANETHVVALINVWPHEYRRDYAPTYEMEQLCPVVEVPGAAPPGAFVPELAAQAAAARPAPKPPTTPATVTAIQPPTAPVAAPPPPAPAAGPRPSEVMAAVKEAEARILQHMTDLYLPVSQRFEGTPPIPVQSFADRFVGILLSIREFDREFPLEYRQRFDALREDMGQPRLWEGVGIASATVTPAPPPTTATVPPPSGIEPDMARPKLRAVTAPEPVEEPAAPASPEAAPVETVEDLRTQLQQAERAWLSLERAAGEGLSLHCEKCKAFVSVSSSEGEEAFFRAQLEFMRAHFHEPAPAQAT